MEAIVQGCKEALSPALALLGCQVVSDSLTLVCLVGRAQGFQVEKVDNQTEGYPNENHAQEWLLPRVEKRLVVKGCLD